MRPDAATRWAVWTPAAALTLFVSYFLLRPGAIVVRPEDCHTGAIAAEILEHGFRLQPSAYTPEIYEWGIVIQGLLTLPFFRLFGANVLALSLLPLVVSVITVLVGMALLNRLLPAVGVESPSGRFVAELAWLAFVAAAPLTYVATSLSAVGDHHEAAALSWILLLLFFRRWEAPGRGRFAALWLVAGFFGFWQKGTLLVAAIAAARELRAARRAPRQLGAATALFLLGYAPGLIANLRTSFGDLAMVAAKFEGRSRVEGLKSCVLGLWLLVDRDPLIGAGMLLALGWYSWQLARDLRAQRALSPAAVIGLYAWACIALVASTQGIHVPYHEYEFPLLALPLAALTGRAAIALSGRLGRAAAPAALALFLLWLHPSLRLDPQRPAALHADSGRAVCGWRFGRAFLREASDPAAACRALGGERALACISGLGLEKRSDDFSGSADERRAYAYGLGQSAVHNGRGETCPAVADPGERPACELGTTLECLTYIDLITQMLGSPPLTQPRCPLGDAPFGEFPAALIADLRRRPAGETTPARELEAMMGPVCGRVFAACYRD